MHTFSEVKKKQAKTQAKLVCIVYVYKWDMHNLPFTVYLHISLGFCSNAFAADSKIYMCTEIQP